MPGKSKVTPGPAPTHNRTPLKNMREAISNYYGGSDYHAVWVQRWEVLANGDSRHTYILLTSGNHRVATLALTADEADIKALLDPLYGKDVSVTIGVHSFFFASGMIMPPRRKDGLDEISVIIPQ